MNEITQFRCVLPPVGSRTLPSDIPAGAAAAPDRMIVRALDPLRDELNMALEQGDHMRALTLAYRALSRVADTLAACRGDNLQPQQVRVHAILVELEILPLEPLPDGTMLEQGTAVTVSYQCWMVQHAVAAAWAQALTERFHTLWPGAWVVVSGNE